MSIYTLTKVQIVKQQVVTMTKVTVEINYSLELVYKRFDIHYNQQSHLFDYQTINKPEEFVLFALDLI